MVPQFGARPQPVSPLGLWQDIRTPASGPICPTHPGNPLPHPPASAIWPALKPERSATGVAASTRRVVRPCPLTGQCLSTPPPASQFGPPPAPAPLVDIAPTGEHRVQPSAPQRTALRQTAQDPVADLTLPAVTGRQ